MLSFGQLLGEEPVRCFCEVSSKHLTISDEKDPEKIMYKLPLVDLAFQLCEVIGSSMMPIFPWKSALRLWKSALRLILSTLLTLFCGCPLYVCVHVVLEIGEQQTIIDMLNKTNCK
jgi:hypothetical protein